MALSTGAGTGAGTGPVPVPDRWVHFALFDFVRISEHYSLYTCYTCHGAS
jgi:hypothetical protein